ncbi:MAG: CBS domain-containing protein [Gloeotrichia echinulata GP01]
MSFTISSSKQIDLAIDQNPITVTMHTSVLEAIALMSQVRGSCTLANSDSALDPNLLEARASCVLVVEETRLVGIFTDRDVVRLTAAGINLNSLEIADVMTSTPITIVKSQFQDVFSILTLFRYHQVRHLPIVDDLRQVLGVVTRESVRRILQPFDLLRVRFIKEVMVTQVIHAPGNASILYLARLMAEHQVSCIVIAERQSPLADSLVKPIGIVTERDIVQFQALELNLQTMQAQTVMSMPLFCLKPEQSLWVAHQEMQRRFIQRLVITGDRQELLGIVTQTSLLDVMDPLQMYGVVEALQRRTGELEAEKIQLLKNRNIQLEQQVQQRTASLQLTMHREKLVAGISSRIRQSLNLDEILQSSVSGVRDFLNCDRVVVYQFGPNLDGIIVAESILPGWTASLNKTIVDTSFRSGIADDYLQGRIRATQDIYQAGLSECHIHFLEQFEIKAYLVVPILISEQEAVSSCQLHSQLCDPNTSQCLWGLLIAHQCSAPRLWLTEESKLLDQLAEQIAIAIQQAQAYQQAHEELAQRQRAEQLLQQLNQELEYRVEQRTAALQESQYFVQHIVDTSPNILYIFDLQEQRNIYVNREIAIILGYSSQDILVMGASFLATVIHPEDLPQVLNYHQQLETAVDGDILEIEYRIKHANGTWRWLNSRESVFAREANGKVKQTIGNATDITSLKQAEANIRVALEKEKELCQRKHSRNSDNERF